MPAAKSEYITYTKGVQTEPIEDEREADNDDQDLRRRRRLSRREQERDEEIRASLRREIEDEIKATTTGVSTDHFLPSAQQRYPLRKLNSNELNAVTGSKDFQWFVERSSKVIERALDEDYDLLVDYTRAATLHDSEDEASYFRTSKKSRSLKEQVQLYSDRTRRRMISDIQFSPHFSELVASSYTKNPSAPNEPAGLVLIWNVHAPSRPEYTFTSASDVLTTRFSPYHPNLVLGGCYSGQICLWDTRVSGRMGMPVQKTPQSGHLGHAHPVYNLSIIGTTNAHNILTASTDGTVCSWSIDMLTQPQEYLELATSAPAKNDDLSPTTMSFPSTDPTFFLVGTEEGSIHPCHRYDRAGAKAGVDSRLVYRTPQTQPGYGAPVTSTQFHPSRGPIDVTDVLLSTSADWTIKLWRIQPAASSSATTSTNTAATSTTTTSTTLPHSNHPTSISPILSIPREDLIYDAKWSPHRPAIFAVATGSGQLEIFDLLSDLEVPVVTAAPTKGKTGTLFGGLNKVAWEERRGGGGNMIATGGLDGVVSVFEVGKGLSGGIGGGGAGGEVGGSKADEAEWTAFKRLVGRLEKGLGY